MFKFISRKGYHTSIERQKVQKELFEFNKTVPHGFPHRPTALAWDRKLHLMGIGTYTGVIRVYGASRVEFSGQHKNECKVNQIFFLPGQGRLITLCDDNALHLWEFNPKGAKWVMEEIKSCSLEGRLKKISTCCLQSSGEHLLIGTEGGNIYLLDIKLFEMTDNIIYQDVVMQNVPDNQKHNPGPVEAIAEHPTNPDKILIGYNRGLLVIWDIASITAEQTYVGNHDLEAVTWHRGGTKFISAHRDGSYIEWSISDTSKPESPPNALYGPFPCKAITKILLNTVKGGDDFLILSGGMPRGTYGDKHTVTVINGEKHQVLDFTSKVVDFFTISDNDDDNADFDNPTSLVVLVEEELVVIDFESEDWLPFRPPYLVSPHSSAITCAQHCSNLPQDLWNKIITAGNKEISGKYSEKEWPINGGNPVIKKSDTHDWLLTGHEDGTVRFWDASSVSLSHIYTLHTANLFDGDMNALHNNEEVEAWPPFRKVGTFDPYSDDPRLAVKKIVICPLSGTLVLSGTAGQIIILKASDEKVEDDELKVSNINIVSDRDNFVWKGHEQLNIGPDKHTFEPGFQPVALLQLSPPAAITALALHSDWELLAVGTAHGFALYDYIQKKPIMSKCTLNPNATGDGSMTRRKSFKKSLRESFRRLRKGRSQRGRQQDKTPTRSGVSEQKKSPRETMIDTDAKSPGDHRSPPISPVNLDPKPVERQIEARCSDDSSGSMVRCLCLAQSFIINNAVTSSTLWAGTNAGAIFVFTISRPPDSKRETEPVTCQLGKEIQLKHRAPVIAIEIMDGSGHPLPNPLEVEKQKAKSPDNFGNHRVLICSEEQFKVFTLPTLKPYGKYKLTAHEGSRVRRINLVKFQSKLDENYAEHCMTCLSNQGDLSIYTIPDLRRQVIYSCLKKEDINGISSLVFSRDGEGFYLHSPCEFQRFSTSARNITDAICTLDLCPGARPTKHDGNITLIPENAVDEVKNNEENLQKDSPVKLEHNSVEDGDISQDRTENEEGLDSSNLVANSSQEVDKKDLDITFDSVTDHLASMSTEESTVLIEKKEESRVIKTQETVTKVTSMTSTSVTRETVVNSTGEVHDQACSNQIQDDAMKNSSPPKTTNTPKEHKAPTAQIEEFSHIDEDGA